MFGNQLGNQLGTFPTYQNTFNLGQNFGVNQQAMADQQLFQSFQNNLKYYSTYLQSTKQLQTNELEKMETKLKDNINTIVSNIAKKDGQKKFQFQAAPNQLSDWASIDVYNHIRDRVKILRENNELIQNKLLSVHNLLEKYAFQTKRLNRDTGLELHLIQEIEDIRRKVNLLQIRYQEHEANLESYEVDEKLVQIEQNARVKDFEEHSIDIMSKISSDYQQIKILLDQCKNLLNIFRQALMDEKK